MSTLNPVLLSTTEAALRAVMPLEAPADVAMSRFFRDNNKLGSQDRAFIAETVFGILRRWFELHYLCEGRVTPRRALYGYLTRFTGRQLRELDALLKPKEKEWLKAIKAMDLDAAPLHIRAELPDWVLAELPGMDEAELLQLGRALAQPAPLDLRVNTLKAKRDAVLERLQADGVQAEATPYSPYGIRVQGRPALNRHPLFNEGAFEIQDEGSQLLGLLLAPRRGEMVADFCAGAGGKTLLLGMLMNSQGRLYAFDISERRLANLKPRLARSGLSNVQPQLLASENDSKIKRLAGKLDRVLVDAPCSGLGTLRRNPDLKLRQYPEAIAELNQKQASILNSAAGLVKAGGRLVYATCSVLPAENQGIVEAFLASHPDFELLPAQGLLPDELAQQQGDYLQLRPDVHGCDGFFAAALQRRV